MRTRRRAASIAARHAAAIYARTFFKFLSFVVPCVTAESRDARPWADLDRDVCNRTPTTGRGYSGGCTAPTWPPARPLHQTGAGAALGTHHIDQHQDM